jgi:hypothetical protein
MDYTTLEPHDWYTWDDCDESTFMSYHIGNKQHFLTNKFSAWYVN